MLETSESHAQEPSTPQGSDEGIAYNFTVRARRTFKVGLPMPQKLFMTMDMVTVLDDDDHSKSVGKIAYDTKGGIVIKDDVNREIWHIGVSEFWRAYLAMRETMLEEDK